jgi:hypothetical protein
METRGYSEGQQKAMRSIMAIMGEWFDHGIVVIKDNSKEFYWETEGDEDMVDILAYKSWVDITGEDVIEDESDCDDWSVLEDEDE